MFAVSFLLLAWYFGRGPAVLAVNRHRLATSLPAGTVIYSNAPNVIARLRKDPDYFIDPRALDPQTIHREEVRRFGPNLVDTSSPWQNRARWWAPPPWAVLQCPSGLRRLVAIGVEWDSNLREGRTQFPICEVYSLDGPDVQMWKVLRQPDPWEPWIQFARKESLTVYTGVVDASDPSHLTLEYDVNGSKGIIDGWLKLDDTMVFSIRSGPATTRPSRGFMAQPVQGPPN